MEKKFDPVIVFSFSKKEVQGYALSMDKCDFTSVEEKEKIETYYENAISSLSEEDRLLIPVNNKNFAHSHIKDFYFFNLYHNFRS